MSVGIRHDDLRRRNRAMVISAVRRAGQPSRTEIAATTGLSHSTISAISSDLIQEGILAESKPSETGFAEARPAAGRPRPQSGSRGGDDRGAVAELPLRHRHRLCRPGDRRGAAPAGHADHAARRTDRRMHRQSSGAGSRTPTSMSAASPALPWASRASPIRMPAPCCGRRSRRRPTLPSPTYWKRNSAFRPPWRTTAT